MMDQKWMEKMQQELHRIEKEYPNVSAPDRAHLRERFQQVRISCDKVLEVWMTLHDQIMHLLEQYPDLENEEEAISEEFWLSESTVRAFRQGQGYYHLKLFIEAKKYFQQVAEEDPEFLLGRLYLALSYFQEGHLDEAQRQFQLAAEMADHDRFVAFASHMLGCVAVRRGEERKAIRYFSKAASLNGEEEDTWFNLGACHFRLEEYHEAIPYFYHALLRDPKDWESMFYLSSCYRKLQQWQSVFFWRLAAYEKTESPEIMESIAHDYEDQGNPEKALAWYQKLRLRDPSRLSAYQGIAWNLWSLGRKDQAISWLKKGLTLAPDHPDLLFTYIWFLLKEGRSEVANNILTRIPAERSAQASWLVVRSELFVQSGQFDEAFRLAGEITQKAKSPAVQGLGHYQQGRVLLEMGRAAEALDHFRHAGRMCPNWRDPLFYEGVCHAVEGRPDVTRNLWQKISLG